MLSLLRKPQPPAQLQPRLAEVLQAAGRLTRQRNSGRFNHWELLSRLPAHVHAESLTPDLAELHTLGLLNRQGDEDRSRFTLYSLTDLGRSHLTRMAA